jgi:hypothetical protein
MISYEMLILEEPDDAIRVATSGLFDFTIGDTECENCGILVGPCEDTYIPCALLVDNEDEEAWPICIDCAFPSLFPGFWRFEL